MTQPTQNGQYNDQPQPASNYGQPNFQQYGNQSYQQPPTEYQYQGYQQQTPAYPPQNYYQPPVAPPPKKGFPGWAWGLIGLAGVAIIAVVVVAIIVTSNKTTKTDPTVATNPTPAATTAAATTTINSATTTVASSSTSGASTTAVATTAAVTTKPATTVAVTTKPATTTAASVPAPILDEGWTNFKPANSGFSIALPQEWQSVDQDSVKTFLDEGLKQLQDKNPELVNSIGAQVKSVFASGVIKFFGFNTASSSGFTTNVNIGKQAVPANITLDAYIQLNVSQVNKSVKLTKPVGQQKVKLAMGEVVQLQYEWSLKLPSGEDSSISTVQYMFISNQNAYIVTFTSQSDELDQNLPLFEQIMDTFRLTN